MTIQKLANIYLETANHEKLHKLEKHDLIKVEWGSWVVPKERPVFFADDMFDHFFKSSLPKPKDVKVKIKEEASEEELKKIIETCSGKWYHCWDMHDSDKVQYFGYDQDESNEYIQKRVELDV